jgi:hypothetical protein
VLRHYLSASGTNSNLVNNGPTLVTHIVAGNSTASTAWLKLYAKKTAPTCGTDAPVATFMLPPTPAGGSGQPLVVAGGAIQFPVGVGFCITGAIADGDTTSVSTGIAVNFGISGYL